MPVCPRCGDEYVAEVRVCRECGVQLVDSLPEEEEPLRCDECDSPVSENDTSCGHCGVLFEEGLKCEAHATSEAIARCLICRRLMCESCAERIAGRAFCHDHNDYRFVENWAVVYTADAEWNASVLVGYLRDKDVDCVVDSKRDTARALTVGHLAQVNLMVPFDRVLEAEKLIEDWEAG